MGSFLLGDDLVEELLLRREMSRFTALRL